MRGLNFLLESLLVFVFIFNGFGYCLGQRECVPEKNYFTDIVKSDGDSAIVLLNFVFSPDSLWVYPKDNRHYSLLKFKITELSCAWTEFFINGAINMRVLMKERGLEITGKLSIIFSKSNADYIELLYDDGVSRIFLINREL